MESAQPKSCILKGSSIGCTTATRAKTMPRNQVINSEGRELRQKRAASHKNTSLSNSTVNVRSNIIDDSRAFLTLVRICENATRVGTGGEMHTAPSKLQTCLPIEARSVNHGENIQETNLASTHASLILAK